MARAPTSRVDLYAAIRRDAKAGRHIIETGSDSYRLAHTTRQLAERP
jgi:hypothetical protein